MCIRDSFFSIGGGINVGQLYSFLNYANQYTKPFNSISSVVTELQNALACAGRLLDLIYEETEVPDADNAEVLQNVDGAVKPVSYTHLDVYKRQI